MVVDKCRPDTGAGGGVKPKPKEKRRNNEKRKEKSRDAARTRRSRETEIFADLGEALPLNKEEVDQLDKASVMRLAIAYLKVRDMVATVCPKEQDNVTKLQSEDDVKPGPDALLGSESEQMLIKEALDGFLMVLSEEGDITYVSENITDLLGLQQIDILSQPIWDYAHQCDHEELRNVLTQKGSKVESDAKSADLFLRLKCTLTSRGRSVNIKSASFKVIHVKGHIVTNAETNKKQLVAIGRPIPHPSNIEVPLGSKMFLTKHCLDMRFSYVDEKMTTLLDYQASTLMGKSLFDYHHGGDSEYLSGAFKCLLSKGQMETRKYRFLGCGGGYAWIVTQATIVYDKQKPQSVVCVNYMISGIENEHEVYSIAQLEARSSLTKETSSCGKENQQPQQQQYKQRQQSLKNSVGQQKVQKNSAAKTVRICEPKKSESNRRNFSPPCPSAVLIPLNASCSATAGSFANRPRSVTEALFAAAPEVVTVSSYPAPAVAATSTPRATITESSSTSDRKCATGHLPPTSAEDMNEGFLQFADEDPDLIMLKEEVDDLSHLAPTPGDACIPLDESTSFLASYEELNDLIDNYIYGDNGFEAAAGAIPAVTAITAQTDSYFADPKGAVDSGCDGRTSNGEELHKPLLKDAIISENVFAAAGLTVANMNEMMCESNVVGCSISNEKKMDPFITYRDESSDTSVATSHLLSPHDCSTQSPDGSLPSSLCSPSESYADEDLAFMTSISMDDDMDLSMRAPYISMSEADDLPLLISEDLMWGALPNDAATKVPSGTKQLNVIMDVASMHASVAQALNPIKASDCLLSSSPATGLLATVRDIESSLLMQQNSNNSRRRKSAAMLENGHEEERANKAFLLQDGGVISVGAPSSSSCSSSGEEANQSDMIEPMFDESMTKNCSTPASWSFTEFMSMDTGSQLAVDIDEPAVYNSSSASSSPCTSDSVAVKRKKQSRANDATSHKRSLTSGGMGLKEMLCATNVRSKEDGAQAKRIRCDDTVAVNAMTNASSQLLQQLMAPTKTQNATAVLGKSKTIASANRKTEMDSECVDVSGNDDQSMKRQQQQQNCQSASPSNSVLMNLLVSGCDVSAGYMCLAPMRPRKTAKV